MITVVVGAGIVGLHIANLLAKKGHEVFVLEKEKSLGEQTSGRNSGVIHAGIFYRSGSLKEELCIEGNRLTYEWLRRLKVDHRPCGKWVVPEKGQEKEIDPFFDKICKLPIPPPQRISAAKIKKLEPGLRASEAILVPSTGILDAAGYVKALGAHLEKKGVQILLNCRVQDVEPGRIETTRGELEFDLGINCAGLFADEIAVATGLDGFEIKPCRGDYYLLNAQPVSRPVYHLPYKGRPGLGIHLTPTLDEQTLLGPNAFFIAKKEDYAHRSPPEAFEKAVRFYLPHLKECRISAGYSGNRPKLYRNGEAVDDFVIEKKNAWIHLLGIESPGLTAAPALAQHVVGLA